MRETFVIKILSNQGATWKGTVDWVERRKTQNFRSTLELIRLIDSTMTGVERPEWEDTAET